MKFLVVVSGSSGPLSLPIRGETAAISNATANETKPNRASRI